MTNKSASNDENRLRSEYEKERALIEFEARLEDSKAHKQRKHEWRLMVVEKLWISVLVLVISAAATFYGNFILEKYKYESTERRAKLAMTRQASKEIWKMLMKFGRSVDEYDYDIEQLQRDHDLAFFKKDISNDTSKVHKEAMVLKVEFSDVYSALDDRKLDLQDGLYPLYRNVLLDLSLLKNIDDGRYASILAGQEVNKFGDAVEKSTKDRIAREEQAIWNVEQELY